MADFVAVLRKTIDGLGETTPEMRAKVYDKARATVSAKLAAISPPPTPAAADRQKRTLEDAIAAIEADFAPKPAPIEASDPLAELENVFAALKAKPAAPPPVAKAASPYQETKPWPAPASRQAEPKPVEPGPETPLEPVAKLPEFDPSSEDPAEGGPSYPLGEDDDQYEETPRRRRSYGGLLAALIALAVIAGGGYAVWLNKDDFSAMLGIGGKQVASTGPTAPAKPRPAEGETARPDTPAADATPDKFTQRLTADGIEVDEGPAGGEPKIGEGTSVATATQQPEPADTRSEPATDGAAAVPAEGAAETPAEPGQSAQIAVGQKAIFYEERTSSAQGSAEKGSVVWSVVQESPGGELPPEPAIRGEATIPGKDLQLRMTIRRNADKTLPASHIIELIFLTPDDFEGGGIDNILRFALKDTEEAAGSPLIGIPAKISDGFFLVALNDSKAEIDANMTLLRRQNWIDVPVIYKSGRRALITMEKGIPGEKVFDEVLKSWQTASAG